MPAPMPAPTPAGTGAWSGDALGALNATVAMLPMAASWGVVAFGAAGLAAVQMGVSGAIVALVLGALVYLLASRAPMPAAAPSSSTALLLGACVARLVQDSALHPATPGGAALLLAATGLAVMGSGAVLVLFGLMRAGALVRFVPQPVLAGFMNGVAVLMVLSQLPVIAGVAADELARRGFGALAQWHWPALVATLLSATVMAAVAWRWPRVPAGLAALVLGTALVLALQTACTGGAPAGTCALQTFGALSAGLPRPEAALALADAPALAALSRHASTLATTALLVALIGGLESALNLAAIDQRLRRRTDTNRELVALGLANVAIGLVGGLPVTYLRLRAMTTLSAGGRGARAVALSCVMLALVFALALPWLAGVPLAVVAGIVVMLAWGLVDRWTRRLVLEWWRGERTAELQWSLVIAAIVCVVTLAAGFVAAVGVGVLLSMLIFMRALHRSLVRLRYSAAEVASRRVYPPVFEARLQRLRPRIEVIELEGALFFGNADRLAQEAVQAGQAALAGRAGPAGQGRGFLVLDLRRVSTIDASGAVGLAMLRERLEGGGVTLLLAGVTVDNRHGRALQAQGMLRPADGGPMPWQLNPDADHAIEAAERTLLQREGADPAGLAVPLARNALLEGLPAPALAALLPRLAERRLQAGERLFGEGDPGDAIYLLTEGSVSVLDRARGQRFVSFSPGMCFGETAVLDGGGRTADARADEASTVWQLPAALLQELQHDQPAVAAQIYRNLALHLSERLRSAAAAWRLAAG
ncbi:MAG: SLC26A/SulP transporter family protein [Burkholderiales bacterium]|nr:SLC26A/SulP transporter family protein [Burkholderiales bacterium]